MIEIIDVYGTTYPYCLLILCRHIKVLFAILPFKKVLVLDQIAQIASKINRGKKSEAGMTMAGSCYNVINNRN